MNRLGFWLVLLVPGLLHAQPALEASAQRKFISGGTIRLHLEAGGYTITPADSENIVVTCRAHTEERLKRVKVEIKPTASIADVYVSETPHNDFHATIEVPRHSTLWARLSAGELHVEDLEGDKNLEVLAGRIQIDIPHPELYGHRDASVTTGSIKSSAFDVSKGGLFRSFEQQGPGKYRLHVHVMTGEIDLRGSDSVNLIWPTLIKLQYRNQGATKLRAQNDNYANNIVNVTSAVEASKKNKKKWTISAPQCSKSSGGIAHAAR